MHALLALGLTLSAQVPVVPDNIDVSGIWLVDRARLGSEASYYPRCFDLFTRGNFGVFGANWLELQIAGPARLERGNEFGQRKKLIVPYKGVLHHAQGYGTRTDLGMQRYRFDYFCHVEPIDYALEGELRVDAYGITLSLRGQAIDPPPYEHLPSGGFSNGRIPNFPGEDIPILWVDIQGDAMYGSTSVGGERVNRGVLPEGCEFFLHNPVQEANAACATVRLMPMTLRRVSDAPTGIRVPIRGELFEGLPNGTRTSSKVNVARIRVYEQDEVYRAQKPTENAVEYLLYREERLAQRNLVDEVRPARDGTFETRPLDVVRRQDGRRNVRRFYTIEVVDAEKWEEVNTPGVLDSRVIFAANVVESTHAGSFHELVLIPATAIEAKINLATSLAEKGPHSWAPIENVVIDVLRPYLMGTPASPADLEGVKRALWAERGVNAGFEYVGPMLEAMLAPLGELAAALFASKVQSRDKAVKEAKEKLKNLQEARIANLPGVGVGAGSATRQQIDRAIEKLLIEDSNLFHENMMKQAKLAMLSLMAAIKVGLVRAGMPTTKADAIHKALKNYVFSLVELVMGNPTGAIKELIKVATKALKDVLIDNPLTPSWCSSTSDALTFSRDRMGTWSVDDPARYAADRDRAVAEISAFHQRMVIVQYGLIALEALSEWATNTSDMFELVPHPYFQAVAKIAKLTRYVSDGVRVVDAFSILFFMLPIEIDVVSHAAFGVRLGPGAGPLGPPRTTPANLQIRDAVITELRALDRAMTTTSDRVAAGDIDAIVQAAAADDATDPLTALARFDLVFARMRADARGAQANDASVASALLVAEGRYLDLRAQIGLATWELSQWLLGAYSGPYESSTDPRYIGDQARVVRAFDSIPNAIDALKVQDIFADWETLRVVPSVEIAELTLTSNATQKDTVTTNPEALTLTARIENVSTGSVGHVRARLAIRGPAGLVSASGPLEQDVGTLAADDGVAGSGPDQRVLTWSVQWRGDLETVGDPLLSIELLEDGSDPVSFLSMPEVLAVRRDETVSDKDGDGILDGYERAHGLDPAVDDGERDRDGDGLSNRFEYAHQLAPDRADSDGDGLSDGEELVRGADGHLSDPLRDDTDGDGVNDAMDGAPTDGLTTAAGPRYVAPVLTLDRSVVHVPPRDRVAIVSVTNTGGSTLSWTVIPPAAPYVVVSPQPPAVVHGNGDIVLTLPETFEASFYEGPQGPLPIEIQVVDLSEGGRVIHPLVASFGRDPPDGGPVVPGSDASAGDAAAIAGRDAGASGPDSEPDDASGCGCRTQGSPQSALALAALLLALAWRRRAIQEKHGQPSDVRNRWNKAT